MRALLSRMGFAQWTLLVLAAASLVVRDGHGAAEGTVKESSPSRPSPGETEVRIEGELEASDAVWVSRRAMLKYGSDVISKIVPEGTKVKKGDFLLQVDTQNWERDKQDAEARVKDGELRVTAGESKVSTARGELDAVREKAEPRVEPHRLAIQRLKNVPDPVELSAAESELERRKAALAEAEEQRTAVEALARDRIVSEQSLMEARFGQEAAAADLVQAEARLGKLRAGATANEIAIAEAELAVAQLDVELAMADSAAKVAQAELALVQAKRRLTRARKDFQYWRDQIPKGSRYAPTDGIVVYEKAYVGGGQVEKIGPGTEVGWGKRILAVIGGRAFRFRGKASEALLGRISVGQRARVQLGALPEAVLKGRVAEFDTVVQREAEPAKAVVDLERLKPKEFDVLIEIEEVPEGLMPGMGGSAVMEPVEAPPGPEAEPRQVDVPEHGIPDQAGPTGVAGARLDLRSLPAFAGYVEGVDKTAVFTCQRVAGDVSHFALQYQWLNKGEVVLETTGGAADFNLEQAVDAVELARSESEGVMTSTEVDARRWQTEARKAALGVKIAELRLAQLKSQPDRYATEIARAEVTKAEAQSKQAKQLFETTRGAGLDSQRELEAKELDATLADLRVDEAQVRLTIVERGASEADLRRAELELTKAREALSYAEAMAQQMDKVKERAVAEADGAVQIAEEDLQFWRDRVEGRTVRAPVAGNIVHNPATRWVGGRIGLGDSLPEAPICIGHMVDLSRLKFCAIAEEPYVNQVKVGAPARVELRAFPGRAFLGQVLSVVPVVLDREQVLMPEGDPSRLSGVRATRADVLLELPQGGDVRILPGMTGTAFLLPPGKEQADARRTGE